MRDVLTMGHSVFGQDWPALAILPSGKTNALAHDLNIPDDWSVLDILRAMRFDRTMSRSPMVVTPLDEPDAAPALGFVLGGGVFTRAIELGQTAHRWGAFDALAVATTTCWSLARCFFGELTDPWRQGSAMLIALGTSREPLARSGHGARSHRQIFLASFASGQTRALRKTCRWIESIGRRSHELAVGRQPSRASHGKDYKRCGHQRHSPVRGK